MSKGQNTNKDRAPAHKIARHAANLVGSRGKEKARPPNDGPGTRTLKLKIGGEEFLVTREGNNITISMFRQVFGARLDPGWEEDNAKIFEHDNSMLGRDKSWASKFLLADTKREQ